MKINRQILIKRVLPIVIGGLLGYAYYYFIGCYNGTCPISSNPYISTIYGGIIGGVFAMPSKKKNKEVKEND